MDKIQKFLAKLSLKERALVEVLLKKIIESDTEGLDLKKLKGIDGIFRVRKGSVRIIFRQEDGVISVIAIERRSDTTYKDL